MSKVQLTHGPTLKELGEALVRADRAGDADSARVLAAAYKELDAKQKSFPRATAVANVPAEQFNPGEPVEQTAWSTPQPGVLPNLATPQNEIPVLDDESRRMQAKNEVFAATGEQTPFGNVLANDRRLQEEINTLKLQRAELYRTGGLRAGREINAQIAALEAQQSSDPYATAGGTAGAMAGAVGGAAMGSAVPGIGTAGGAFTGSMMGGFLGTLGGALVYANKENMTPKQTSDYLFKQGITSMAFDAVGNIVFMGGSKVLGKIAKDSAPGRALLKLMGGSLEPKLKAPREAYLPGERVFKDTTEDQLRDATTAGARIISSTKSTPSAGQLTGDPGLIEGVVRSKDPGGFAAVRREQEDLLEDRVAKEIARMRGDGSKYAGTDLRKVLDDTESTVKQRLAPVWDELRNMRGKESVDFSEVSTWAKQLLDTNANAKVKTLTGEQLGWVRKLAAGGKGMSPGEAQDVLTKMLAIARDAQSPTNPNSEMAGFATKVAGMIRSKLDDALASDPKFAEARELYRDMMTTLYSPVLDAARRGGESAAGRKAIKLGEVEGVQALDDLLRLTGKVDKLAGSNLSATAGAAHRGATSEFFEKYAGTPDALARLHGQMGNPDFRKTFEATVPDATNRKIIENLSQAAQLAQRNKGMSGSFGVEAGASSLGRAVGQSINAPNVGSMVGRLMVMLSSKDSAKAFTTPEIKVQLPRLTAWMVHAARGGGRATEPVPEWVVDTYKQLEAELKGQ
jgi:hypothetical protein